MELDNYPILKPTAIIKALKKMGFYVTKTKNSHKLLVHESNKRTTIPVQRGQLISPLLLDRILKDIFISAEEFNTLL